MAVGLILGLSACGSDTKTTGVYANQGAGIGLAMPPDTSTRWILDSNAMRDQFKAMGYKPTIAFANKYNGKSTDGIKDPKLQTATQIANQQKQVQKMIDDGDKLLVISAVDGTSLSKQLADAGKKGVKVIAYDRLLTKTNNVDYQATFDGAQVGKLQADLLISKLGLDKGGADSNVEIFAGSSTDANATAFYNASMAELKKYINEGKIVIRSGQTSFADVATSNWDGTVAGNRMDKILDTYYKHDRLDAVLSPYDGMTIGILKSLKAHGYGSTQDWPFTSGQDAELASVKAIVKGEQTETIYKDTRELAKVAVQQGNAMLTGGDVIGDTMVPNDAKKVPTYLLHPVVINKQNYKTLLVQGGYYSQTQIDKEPDPLAG
jgi:putative multiple sugar transport system substrate-binding protein